MVVGRSVILDEWFGHPVVSAEALKDDLLIVIGSPHESGAVSIADIQVGRRSVQQVVDLATNRTLPPRAHAGKQHGAWDVEVDHRRRRPMSLTNEYLQEDSLMHRAGVAVEQAASDAIRLGDPPLDDAIDQFVTHKVSRFHLKGRRAAIFTSGPEHVPSRDRW